MALLLAQSPRTTHSSHHHHTKSLQFPTPPLQRYQMAPPGSSSGSSSVGRTPGPSVLMAQQASQHSAHSSYSNTPTLAVATVPTSVALPASEIPRQATAESSHRQHEGQPSTDAGQMWNYSGTHTPQRLMPAVDNAASLRPVSSDGVSPYSATTTPASRHAINGPPVRPVLATFNSMPNHISIGTGIQHQYPSYQHLPPPPPHHEQHLRGTMSQYDTSPHSHPQAELSASGLMMGSQYASVNGDGYTSAGLSSAAALGPPVDGVRVPFVGEGASHYQYQYQSHLQPHDHFVGAGGDEGGMGDYESNDLRREGGWNPFEVKHRRRTTKGQFRVLEDTFQKTPKPSNEVRKAISEQLDMPPRAVQIWFQNRRAKAKTAMRKAAAAAAAAGRPHHHAALMAKQEEDDMNGLAGTSASPSDAPGLNRRISGNSGNSTSTSLSDTSDLGWKGQPAIGNRMMMQSRYPYQPGMGGPMDGRRLSSSAAEAHGAYAPAPALGQQYGQQMQAAWRSQQGPGSVPMSGPSQSYPAYRPGMSGHASQDLYSSPNHVTLSSGASYEISRDASQHSMQQAAAYHQQPGSYYTTAPYDVSERSWRHERE